MQVELDVEINIIGLSFQHGNAIHRLKRLSQRQQVFDLTTAVKKMTGMPADQIGLKDRGRIARGMKADLVVFDAERVKDEATFDDPHRYATGIQYVMVNGELVVNNGKHTGKRPGQVLRRS